MSVEAAGVIYHPSMLDALGLEDPGDYDLKMQGSPRYPRGSGRTTRMMLEALRELAQGRRVLILAWSGGAKFLIGDTLKAWMAVLNITLEPEQLMVRAGWDREGQRQGFSGSVFEDHAQSGKEDIAMTIQEFEKKHRVRLVRKDKLRAMRLANKFMSLLPPFRNGEFMSQWWTTYRLPGQAVPTIAVGTDPKFAAPTAPEWETLRQHELVHANDMRKFLQLLKMALLLVVFPLPIFFSGRWFIERHAYLVDIAAGHRTPQQAAEKLWNNYLMPWPKKRMVAWFNKMGPF